MTQTEEDDAAGLGFWTLASCAGAGDRSFAAGRHVRQSHNLQIIVIGSLSLGRGAGVMGDGDDSEWREYNVHGETEHAFDIFASNDEVEYDTLHYTCRDGRLLQINEEASDDKSIVVRSEKNWHKSTGMSVCRGSELLCSYLLKHPDVISNKRTLELGCGTGLVGM